MPPVPLSSETERRLDALFRGELGALRQAVRAAKVVWRDVLVAAGFGHSIKAHGSWMPEPRKPGE